MQRPSINIRSVLRHLFALILTLMLISPLLTTTLLLLQNVYPAPNALRCDWIPLRMGEFQLESYIQLFVLVVTALVILTLLIISTRKKSDLALFPSTIAMVAFYFVGQLAVISSLVHLAENGLYQAMILSLFPLLAMTVATLASLDSIKRLFFFMVIGAIIYFAFPVESNPLPMGVYSLTTIGFLLVDSIKYLFFPTKKENEHVLNEGSHDGDVAS